MFNNLFYETYKNTMHLWYTTDDGKRLYRKEQWVPYVFVENPEGNTKTIFGKNTFKKEFSSFKAYNEYQKNNKNGLNENNCRPEVQYLVEKYYNIEDDDLIPPKLKVYSIDIEVNPENNVGVFPNPHDAAEPITAITIYDWNDDHYYVFGLHPYKKKSKNVSYFDCRTEENLLKRFLKFAYKYPPDIYTGWNICHNSKMNISGFDFPYIVNRCENILDKDAYKLLSPIKVVKKWEKEGNISITIAGVSLLDYQSLYKWYSFNNPEKYTLDFICELELGEKKLEYEGSLSELYKNDWQKYIDYNIKDTELIKKLDEKLGYINLVQSICLISRAPFESYYAMTTVLEGKLLTHYRRNNMCAPFFSGGIQTTFPAAYVKEPDSGLHDWIVSVDIASSYPTAIVTLNMSNETYLGRIHSLTEDEIIDCVTKKEFPKLLFSKHDKRYEIKEKGLIKFNNMLKKGKITVAPCGTVFKTDKIGVIAYTEKEMFLKRKEIKRRMKKCEGEENKRLYTFQWALKILLNSMYGITSVPYSRYFNLDISKAITACGRHTVKMGEKFANELLNDPNDELKKIIDKMK